MKTFKSLDLAISIALIILFTILLFIQNDLELLIMSYSIVGGWQVISMITHEMNNWFVKRWNNRRIYHIIVLISLITMPMGFAWVFVFTAPFMAVGYSVMCWQEIQIIKKRELIHLK